MRESDGRELECMVEQMLTMFYRVNAVPLGRQALSYGVGLDRYAATSVAAFVCMWVQVNEQEHDNVLTTKDWARIQDRVCEMMAQIYVGVRRQHEELARRKGLDLDGLAAELIVRGVYDSLKMIHDARRSGEATPMRAATAEVTARQ